MTDMQNLLAGMVKPLVWEKRQTEDQRPQWFTPNEDGLVTWMHDGRFRAFHASSNHEQRLDAIAAEEHHYTARILAALNPDPLLALVAAAYEDVASELDTNHPGDDGVYSALSTRMCCSGHECGCQGADVGSFLQWIIRARTPTDATAALERMLAEARAEGLEMAAKVADAESEKSWALYKGRGPECADPHYQGMSDGQEKISAAIRAMKGEGV